MSRAGLVSTRRMSRPIITQFDTVGRLIAPNATATKPTVASDWSGARAVRAFSAMAQAFGLTNWKAAPCRKVNRRSLVRASPGALARTIFQANQPM